MKRMRNEHSGLLTFDYDLKETIHNIYSLICLPLDFLGFLFPPKAVISMLFAIYLCRRQSEILENLKVIAESRLTLNITRR